VNSVSQRHADLRTGAFVAVGILALLGLIMGLPRLLRDDHLFVTVRFPVSAGAMGVAAGTPIYFGGLKVGHVAAIALSDPTESDHPSIVATMGLLQGVVVPRTASVKVERSITGSDVSLVITLSNSSHEPSAQAGDTLAANIGATPLQTLFGDVRAANIERAISNFKASSPDAVTRDLGERSATLADEVRGVSQQLRGDWAQWQPQAEALSSAADQAQARFNDLRALFAEGAPLDAARLEGVFARTRENWITSTELTETLRVRLTEQVAPPLSDLIDRIKRVIATVKADTLRVESIIAQSGDALRQSSADLSIAGDQIGRTTREVTLMPWTLLGSVFEDRSEEARFRTFAREIVRSAADLHIAVATARSLLEDDPALAQRHPELVELLRRWIDQASAEHEAAGTILLNQLIGVPAP
jgi:ABC-type transporter Mla subunit MlaD